MTFPSSLLCKKQFHSGGAQNQFTVISHLFWSVIIPIRRRQSLYAVICAVLSINLLGFSIIKCNVLGFTCRKITSDNSVLFYGIY